MIYLKIILLEGLWQKMEWIPQEYSQEIWQTHFGGPRCTLCTFVQITIFNMFMGIHIHNVHMWLSNLLCHMPWLLYCGIHYIFLYWTPKSTIFMCTLCIKFGSQLLYIRSIVFIVILSQYWPIIKVLMKIVWKDSWNTKKHPMAMPSGGKNQLY